MVAANIHDSLFLSKISKGKAKTIVIRKKVVILQHRTTTSMNTSKKETIMTLSTTPQIEGHTIREYKGIVTGETIIGANMFKDFFAGIRDIVGGRAGSYEKVLAEAKDTSLKEMMQRAEALGANAIVGIDIDYETIGANNSMLMVATSGTAVVI
jgi:uncharacterized protein YbjQ (UPF0145 family)